ncbi:MAG: adenylate/guanylate cyclase domain-containing protein [Mariprofundaceae bacterium]|nr:adenylate/guanylate cyclase domain-containing protein [Mariprofundaceae bacterium]
MTDRRRPDGGIQLMMDNQPQSFRNQIHIVLCLLGIIPYLLFVYIFYAENFGITESVLLLAAIVLGFHLGGFRILHMFAEKLSRLVRLTDMTTESAGVRELPVDEGATTELAELTRHFNRLLKEIEDQKEQYDHLTIELLKHAKANSKEYQRQIAEIEAVHERLKPYIGTRIADLITQTGEHALQTPEYRVVTVLFADIRGFTSLSEETSPEEIVAMLNEYFDMMVNIIHKYHGVLDKFIGDELMAVFGLLTTAEAGPLDAVRAAMEMQDAVQALMHDRELQGKPVFKIGIGINTGEAISGSIGSRDRMDYTVIGDTVNVASRLEGMTQGNEILVSDAMYRECRGIVAMKKRGEVQVKNRATPVKCYEVLGYADGD